MLSPCGYSMLQLYPYIKSLWHTQRTILTNFLGQYWSPALQCFCSGLEQDHELGTYSDNTADILLTIYQIYPDICTIHIYTRLYCERWNHPCLQKSSDLRSLLSLLLRPKKKPGPPWCISPWQRSRHPRHPRYCAGCAPGRRWGYLHRTCDAEGQRAVS